VRNQPQAEAERAAFDIVLVEFLNATHPDTDPNRCAWCGLAEAGLGDLRPYGTDARGLAWLHPERCWKPWRDKRRADAAEALRNIGITEPPLPPSSTSPAIAGSSIANGADAVPAHHSAVATSADSTKDENMATDNDFLDEFLRSHAERRCRPASTRSIEGWRSGTTRSTLPDHPKARSVESYGPRFTPWANSIAMAAGQISLARLPYGWKESSWKRFAQSIERLHMT
jgi:hypothetical protein